MWAEDLTVCVTGYPPWMKKKIQSKVERAGGRYHPNLSKAVTHLVVSSSALRNPSDKLKTAFEKRKSGTWRLTMVQAQWLRLSLTERRIVDWKPFQIDLAHAQSGQMWAPTRAALQPLDVNQPNSLCPDVGTISSPAAIEMTRKKQRCEPSSDGRACEQVWASSQPPPTLGCTQVVIGYPAESVQSPVTPAVLAKPAIPVVEQEDSGRIQCCQDITPRPELYASPSGHHKNRCGDNRGQDNASCTELDEAPGAHHQHRCSGGLLCVGLGEAAARFHDALACSIMTPGIHKDRVGQTGKGNKVCLNPLAELTAAEPGAIQPGVHAFRLPLNGLSLSPPQAAAIRHVSPKHLECSALNPSRAQVPWCLTDISEPTRSSISNTARRHQKHCKVNLPMLPINCLGLGHGCHASTSHWRSSLANTAATFRTSHHLRGGDGSCSGHSDFGTTSDALACQTRSIRMQETALTACNRPQKLFESTAQIGTKGPSGAAAPGSPHFGMHPRKRWRHYDMCTGHSSWSPCMHCSEGSRYSGMHGGANSRCPCMHGGEGIWAPGMHGGEGSSDALRAVLRACPDPATTGTASNAQHAEVNTGAKDCSQAEHRCFWRPELLQNTAHSARDCAEAEERSTGAADLQTTVHLLGADGRPNSGSAAAGGSCQEVLSLRARVEADNEIEGAGDLRTALLSLRARANPDDVSTGAVESYKAVYSLRTRIDPGDMSTGAGDVQHACKHRSSDGVGAEPDPLAVACHRMHRLGTAPTQPSLDVGMARTPTQLKSLAPPPLSLAKAVQAANATTASSTEVVCADSSVVDTHACNSLADEPRCCDAELAAEVATTQVESTQLVQLPDRSLFAAEVRDRSELDGRDGGHECARTQENGTAKPDFSGIIVAPPELMEGMVWRLGSAVDSAELSEWDSLDSVVVRAPTVVLRARGAGPLVAGRTDISSKVGGLASSGNNVEVVVGDNVVPIVGDIVGDNVGDNNEVSLWDNVEATLSAPGGALTAREVLNAVREMLAPLQRLQQAHAVDAAESSVVMDGLRKVSPPGCVPVVYEVQMI